MPCPRLPRIRQGLIFLGLLAATATATPEAEAVESTAEQTRFFESKIRPVLVEQCVKCHGPDKQKSNLRLDSRAAALTGGDLGPAIVPGKPDESPIVAALRHADDLKMPPSRKLPREVADDFARWVTMGAPWSGPGGEATSTSATPATPKRGPLVVSDQDRKHWAFQPVRPTKPPATSRPSWVRTPVDAFILAGLETRGLQPNPPADKVALIRRITYDLTGLPPGPAEVAAFLADTSDTAYERVVERLLDSPHYGEKWGRHWLDLVRFAETNSYERDNPKPSAWRYRDYVIRSFNNDKPFDRFVREQLAGDELPDGGADGLIATGFYRLGIWDDEPTDRELSRYDGLDDIVATTGQVFLGLTVDCARCHDHKIDPIPQADYYRLLAFVQNVNHFRNGGPTDEVAIPASSADGESARAYETVRAEQLKQIKARIESIERDFIIRGGTAGRDPAKLVPPNELAALIREKGEKLLGKDAVDNHRTLRRQLRAMENEKPTGATALCVTEAGPTAPETYVLLRGNPHVKGDRVEPGFPAVLSTAKPVIPTPAPDARSTGRRTVLADWIASPSNPLTARVMANRVWQHHFGRGIVRSPSNFGLQGDRPTHPELLDWLASELIAGGWRLKSLHRTIVLSNAYQMSSRGNPEALAKDPLNDTFWRFDMRRLTAEEVRDSSLVVSGTFNPRMYGPGVYPEIPAEVLAGQSVPGKGWGNSSPREQARRSIYVHVKRSLLLPILEGFDLAETDRSSPVRFSTTQPTQALAMLNGKFLNDQAAALANRLSREAGPVAADQVRLALSLATSRTPTPAEVKRGLVLIDALRADGLAPDQALRDFSLVVLNLNEFLYLD